MLPPCLNMPTVLCVVGRVVCRIVCVCVCVYSCRVCAVRRKSSEFASGELEEHGDLFDATQGATYRLLNAKELRIQRHPVGRGVFGIVYSAGNVHMGAVPCRESWGRVVPADAYDRCVCEMMATGTAGHRVAWCAGGCEEIGGRPG
jgi:hypothetical protein